MLDEVRITSPQGIGDILWSYQLIKPQARRLHFNVISFDTTPKAITRRAEAVISKLPGVASISYVPAPKDNSWLSERRSLRDALNEMIRVGSVAWSPNPALEAGVPLEFIEPGFAPCWDLGLKIAPPAGMVKGSYLLCYVSGDTIRHQHLENGLWSPAQWSRLIDRACYANSVGTSLPIVFIGSAFDYPILVQISELLKQTGFKVHVEIDPEVSELLGWFAHSRFFFGYQSGLNALADYANARQLMLYFTRLDKMTDTWVRPEHRSTGQFRWSYFNRDPDEVAKLAWFTD